MWSFPFSHLVLVRDQLIHLKLLHRIYYTPAKLSRIYPGASAECWHSSHSPTNFGQIFWHCPVVQEYWSAIVRCITEITSLAMPMTVANCLLGLVESLVPTRAQRTLFSLLLFYARKALILYWKKPMTTLLSYWKGLLNKVIPFYKATYLH